MNEEQFWESYRGSQQPTSEDPRQKYYASINALEEKIAQASFSGRVMLGSIAATLGFGTLTLMYAKQEDTVTATLCGLITFGLGIGAAYARNKTAHYRNERTQLVIKHIPIKYAYDQHIKEEGLNQRRSQGHEI